MRGEDRQKRRLEACPRQGGAKNAEEKPSEGRSNGGDAVGDSKERQRRTQWEDGRSGGREKY